MKRFLIFFCLTLICVIPSESALNKTVSEIQAKPRDKAPGVFLNTPRGTCDYLYSDARFTVGAPFGEPVHPGEPVEIVSSGFIFHTSVAEVVACFFNDGILQDAVPQEHTIFINDDQELEGDIPSLDFGTAYYADSVKFAVKVYTDGPPLFRFGSYNELSALYDQPIVPALRTAGIAVLALFFTVALIWRKRRLA